MRIKFENEFVDYELSMFFEIAHELDKGIESCFALLREDFSMADSLDYPLRLDQLFGVGLATAQVYLVEVTSERGAPRQRALQLGPRHDCGRPVAELINHGANFWKHADEWDWESIDPRKDRILAAFSDMGIEDGHVCLCEVVSRITHIDEPRLRNLSPYLEEWRTAVEDAYPRSSMARSK